MTGVIVFSPVQLTTQIVTAAVGGALFLTTATAGCLIMATIRRSVSTFLLMATMLAADALYGLSHGLNAAYALSIIGVESGLEWIYA